MALPSLDVTTGVTERHLLLLPGDVGADEVEVLAVSRFPRATGEVGTSTVPSGRTRGARSPRLTAPPPGVLRLSRHSVLMGPFAVGASAAVTLGVPAGVAYELHAPVERGERPWPGSGDRDGLARAFPDGLPVRDEERSVAWLVAAARRLGGAVRIASGADRPAALLVPDPAAAVDLSVWTDIWLEPEAALTVVRRALPRAVLNLPTTDWAGPPRGTGETAVRGTDDMAPQARRALHRAADERDVTTLTEPPPMQAYGCLAGLDLDGIVAVEIGGEAHPPPVIAAVPWARDGAVAYHVRWEPTDLADLHAERPSPLHRAARGRATPLVVAVARALHSAVGGEITDEMGFVVDPADL